MTAGANPTREEMAACSRAFRAGLLECYLEGTLRPTELALGLVLCEGTFDAGRARGFIRLDDWARRLGLIERKGLRTDKCGLVLKTLNTLGAVDLNAAQGTFELRPDADLWSFRARSHRARAFSNGAAAAELPLRCERPLSEQLSQDARDRAARGEQPVNNRGGPSAEKSADTSGDFADTSAEKSADATHITFKRLTFCTENVQRLERSASAKSADAESGDVRAAVRRWVGEADWARHWARADYLWANPARVARLAGSLRYLAAGVAEGTVAIRSTRGAALWSQAQIDWRRAAREVTA